LENKENDKLNEKDIKIEVEENMVRRKRKVKSPKKTDKISKRAARRVIKKLSKKRRR